MNFDIGEDDFNKADLNRDGYIDRKEFNLWNDREPGVGGGVDSRFNAGAGGSTSSAICNPPTYPTDARGFYRDPNPRLENRANPNPGSAYTQNIRIRFLQPPPGPPLKPDIVRQVRRDPPGPPTPFRRTIPPRPAIQPPPLVLRERPPQRREERPPRERIQVLPPFPAVPRSVVTEEYPPLPPRPRDIIMERWVPYGPPPKRPEIIIPAPCGPFPTPPRNVVIRYEFVPARVSRQFQRLGVTQADPEAYLQQYGASLLDSGTFVQHARAAGVVEDIAPPAYSGSFQSARSTFNEVSSSGIINGEEFGGGLDVDDTAFRNADTNRDGVLSDAEFGNSVQQGP